MSRPSDSRKLRYFFFTKTYNQIEYKRDSEFCRRRIDNIIPELVSASGIYFIKSRVDRRFYIGRSKHIKKRIHTHLSKLIRGTHSNRELQRVHDLGEGVEILTHYIERDNFSLLKYETALIGYFRKTQLLLSIDEGVKMDKRSIMQGANEFFKLVKTRQVKKLSKKYGSKSIA